MDRNVPIINQLLEIKADDFKQDAFLALLEFCNSPISSTEQSPVELLMSRKLRTKLPTSKHLLNPRPQVRNYYLLCIQRSQLEYDIGVNVILRWSSITTMLLCSTLQLMMGRS